MPHWDCPDGSANAMMYMGDFDHKLYISSVDEFCERYAGECTDCIETEVERLAGRQDDFCMICLEKKSPTRLYPQTGVREVHLCPRRFCESCYYVEPDWRKKGVRFDNPIKTHSGWMIQTCLLCRKRSFDVVHPLLGHKNPSWSHYTPDEKALIQSARYEKWVTNLERPEHKWRASLLMFPDVMTLESDRKLLKAIDLMLPSPCIKKDNIYRYGYEVPKSGMLSAPESFHSGYDFVGLNRWIYDVRNPGNNIKSLARKRRLRSSFTESLSDDRMDRDIFSLSSSGEDISDVATTAGEPACRDVDLDLHASETFVTLISGASHGLAEVSGEVGSSENWHGPEVSNDSNDDVVDVDALLQTDLVRTEAIESSADLCGTKQSCSDTVAPPHMAQCDQRQRSVDSALLSDHEQHLQPQQEAGDLSTCAPCQARADTLQSPVSSVVHNVAMNDSTGHKVFHVASNPSGSNQSASALIGTADSELTDVIRKLTDQQSMRRAYHDVVIFQEKALKAAVLSSNELQQKLLLSGQEKSETERILWTAQAQLSDVKRQLDHAKMEETNTKTALAAAAEATRKSEDENERLRAHLKERTHELVNQGNSAREGNEKLKTTISCLQTTVKDLSSQITLHQNTIGAAHHERNSLKRTLESRIESIANIETHYENDLMLRERDLRICHAESESLREQLAQLEKERQRLANERTNITQAKEDACKREKTNREWFDRFIAEGYTEKQDLRRDLAESERQCQEFSETLELCKQQFSVFRRCTGNLLKEFFLLVKSRAAANGGEYLLASPVTGEDMCYLLRYDDVETSALTAPDINVRGFLRRNKRRADEMDESVMAEQPSPPATPNEEPLESPTSPVEEPLESPASPVEEPLESPASPVEERDSSEERMSSVYNSPVEERSPKRVRFAN